MVFKVYQEAEALTEFQRSYSMKYILESLSDAGLSIRSFYSVKVIASTFPLHIPPTQFRVFTSIHSINQ